MQTKQTQQNFPEMSELSTGDIQRIWVQMLSIYGHKWASINGTTALKNDLSLTIQGAIWQKGLSGIDRAMASKGFSKLSKKNPEWPPVLFEFLNLCKDESTHPSLSEVASILSNRYGLKIVENGYSFIPSIAKSNKHPLVFAIRKEVNCGFIRQSSAREAEKYIKPVYDRLIKDGYPDWPENAFNDQIFIEKKSIPMTLDQKQDVLKMLRDLKKSFRRTWEVKKIKGISSMKIRNFLIKDNSLFIYARRETI